MVRFVSLQALIVAVVLIATSASPVSSQSGIDTTVIVIEAGPSYDYDLTNPQTDGAWIVWMKDPVYPRTPYSELYAASIADRDPFGVRTHSGSIHFDIDDGFVIWTESITEYHDRQGVYGYDLASRTEVMIHPSLVYGPVLGRYPSPDDEHANGLAGRFVAWRDGASIVRCSIPCSAGPTPLYTIPDGTSLTGLTADGGRLLWLETSIAGDADRPIALMSLDPGATSPQEVLVIPSLVTAFDTASGAIAYLGEPTNPGNSLHFNNVNGPSKHVADYADSVALSEDGRYVVWTDARQETASDNQAYDLQCYDTLTQSRFVAQSTTRPNEHRVWHPMTPSFGGNVLAWARQEWANDIAISDGNFIRFGSEVHAAPISALLPSAAREDPGTTDANWRWFPETGHYLSFAFRVYWEAHGGVSVFGFPITEEFSEENAGTAQAYVTQFTERQRFEWHPEYEGTPYQVLLGRLGAELLEAQGRDWKDLPTGDPADPHFFPETGHGVPGPFYAYWVGHGLDFGDTGTSFRESLALFGYPLSEPMVETNADGDTVLTQYFERAVFEYHPDNPSEWQVLLRRLGVESIAGRGW